MDQSILHYFSKHCRSVLEKAYHYAKQEKTKEITVFQLFRAIAGKKGSVGSNVLENVKIKRITAKTNFKKFSSSDPIPFSVPARRSLVHAVKLAQDFESPYVGTEHLLYAILTIGDKDVMEYLKEKKVQIDQVLPQLQQVMSHNGEFTGGSFNFLAQFKDDDLSEKERKKLMKDIVGEVSNFFTSIYDKKRKIEPPKFNPHQRPSFGMVMNRPQPGVNLLSQFAIDLNKEILEGKVDPVIGREKEIDEMICILMRKNKNNPVMVGEPGVGKTAVVNGLAWKLLEKDVPTPLVGKKVYSLDLGLLIAGTSFRGEFEDRFKRVLDEIEKDPDAILFIDELHNLVGAGSAQGSMDAANIIKPALARGQVKCIGATTLEEYHKYIEKDGALERRFQSVWLKEPSTKEVEEVLKGVKRFYETHHRVKISNSAIKHVVRLAERFITDRFFPDKALDLLDEAASYVIQDEFRQGTAKDLQRLETQQERLKYLKEKMVRENYLDTAVKLDKNEKNLKNVVSKLEKKVANERKMIPVMDEKDVAEVLARKMNLPAQLIMEDADSRLGRLPLILNRVIKGQTQAIDKISSNLQRGLAGVADPDRPSAAFLFVGPTGVGKTYLAKLLAEKIFMHPDSLVKVDMSEFGEKHTVSRLLGSPPGYVGYSEKNSFADRIRKNPYSLILFDEIEKAHPEVFHVLLQVLEDGVLTDSMGRKISFKNTIIIFTSNLGNEDFLKEVVGFSASNSQNFTKAEITKVKKRLSDFFRPEFLNRLSDIVFFNLLNQKELEEIAVLELRALIKRLKKSKRIEIKFNNEVALWLGRKSISKKEGARKLRRIIQEQIEEPLAKMILGGKLKEKETVVLKISKNQLQIKVLAKKVKKEVKLCPKRSAAELRN